MTAPDPAATGYVPARRPRRELRWLVVALAGALLVGNLVGAALTPALAARHPLVLLAFESPIRNMLLASRAPVGAFLAVVVARRLVGSLLFYLVGRWYGDAALDWLERHAGSHGAKVRKVERAVRAGAYPLVFASPTAVVCMVAGAMGIPPARFALVAAVGALTVGAVVRLAGEALADPIGRVLSLFEHNLVTATVAAVVLVLGGAAWQWYPRKRVVITGPPPSLVPPPETSGGSETGHRSQPETPSAQ